MDENSYRESEGETLNLHANFGNFNSKMCKLCRKSFKTNSYTQGHQ